MSETTSPQRQEAPDHLSGYQARDWEIVDYRMYQDPHSGLWFRGPEPDLSGPRGYFACLGAAQTFGCFVEQPYPNLLAGELGLPALNLGYGGAGPRFYLRHPELLEKVNAARFAIVQVMSARSEDNHRFESGGLEYLTDRRTAQKVSATDAYQRLLDEADASLALPPRARRALRIFHGPKAVRQILRETRQNWIDNYRELLSAIRVPVVLFWFSKRSERLNRSRRVAWWWQRYDNANALFGEYPQLVNPSMVRALTPHAGRYVRCVSRRGSPQRLVSRFTGKPTVVDYSKDRPDLAELSPTNPYYPSPEMQQDAARALRGPCRRLLT